MEFLIENGADPSVGSQKNDSALNWAISEHFYVSVFDGNNRTFSFKIIYIPKISGFFYLQWMAKLLSDLLKEGPILMLWVMMVSID